MTICSTCTDLTAWHHHGSLSDLVQGVRKRCRGCIILAQGIEPTVREIPSITHFEWVVDRSMHITLLDGDKQSLITTEIYVEAGTPFFAPSIGPGRTVLTEGWVEGHRKLARQWLSGCFTHHRICPPLEDRPLPTRVIEVGSDNNSLSLHISNGQLGQYVALSHSWGGHKPVETTTANLSKHCESIELDTSSQTFADAAQVCRDLGFKYLWIDSLCIVQNDTADWTTEASKMSTIYRNAALTISAESAPDARAGLFTQKHTTQAQAQLRCTAPTGDSAEVTFRLRAPNRQASSTPGTTTSTTTTNFAHASVPVSESHLARRAWILQERLLSPRILHFYREELAWSCCAVSRCECRLDAAQTDTNVFKTLHLLSSPVRSSSSGGGSNAELARKVSRNWPALVVEFTHRRLTKLRDRLAALSGLANACHEVTRSRYCAGLFLDDLGYGLLWMSDHGAADGQIGRNSEVLGLPSWSWAGTAGPVRYLERHRSQFDRKARGDTIVPLLEVVGAYTLASGPNAFGDVAYGWVCVRAQILRVQCRGGVWTPWNQRLTSSLEAQDARLPVVTPDCFGPGAELGTGDVYFVRAGKHILGGMWSSVSTENVCLVVQKVGSLDGIERPLFRRWGVALHAFPSDLVWVERYAPRVHVFMI